MKHRKVLISIIAILLAFLMLGGVLFNALMVVSAASSSALKSQLDELKDQADDIADRVDALQVDISENESETMSVVEKKSNIDMQIDLTRQQIENLNAQIQQYNLLIAAKQEELDAALEEEAAMNERYKDRIRAMEESGDISYWSILFQASSFSDLLSRVDWINEVAQSDQKMILQMQEMAAEIAAAKADIEADRAALEEARAELDTLQVQLDAQRAEADTLISSLIVEQDELVAAYEEYDQLEEELRQQILEVQEQYEKALADEEAARRIEEARAQAAAGNRPSASSSGFLYPLGSSATITDAYGYRYHPVYGYYKMHYGVDLAVSQGTPIYASKSGTVTVATYGSANGYYVTINHNDGFASTYAHMTHYVVSPGQYVSQGQVIGYVGSTGWSTGPHLHFEILYGGSNVNPMEYISLR